MLLNKKSKEISNDIRKNASTIRGGIYKAFENAILSSGKEVQFIDKLSSEIKDFFSKLKLPGLLIRCRSKIIHRKPIVKIVGSGERCELGDLLVVIKYYLRGGSFEAKSVIYQVKLATSNTSTCNIDQTQLNLLCDWPQFSFGQGRDGKPQNFDIHSNTLEFGSYMLEPRKPIPKQYLPKKKPCYGVSPYALMVRDLGPAKINIKYIPYIRGDAHNFFSHLAFEIGEHHSNKSIQDFVNALYRHVGLAPDPPDEFNDYFVASDDDGFGIMEIIVKSEEASK